MKWLLSSDLHLTDRPKDAYRFGIFGWLAKQQRKCDTTEIFILGDLTDRKDNHSSLLVNRLIDGLSLLKPPVHILMGNHDYVSHPTPFFKFLNCIEGLHFISEPTFLPDLGMSMIPHMPDQAQFDAACGKMPKGSAFMGHLTVNGAMAETGAPLTGLSASPISRFKVGATWAGDVHKPQRMACGLVYVGSPYHVRFSDSFTPRCLLVEGGGEGVDLHFPCLRKWALTIRDADELLTNLDLRPGDQVKITIQLAREEVVEWAAHKQRVLGACKELGLEVFGIGMDVATNTPTERIKADVKATTPSEVFDAFCKSEGLALGIKQAGEELLRG